MHDGNNEGQSLLHCDECAGSLPELIVLIWCVAELFAYLHSRVSMQVETRASKSLSVKNE